MHPLERLGHAELPLARPHDLDVRGEDLPPRQRPRVIRPRPIAHEQRERPDLLDARVGARSGVEERVDRPQPAMHAVPIRRKASRAYTRAMSSLPADRKTVVAPFASASSTSAPVTAPPRP